MVYATEHILNAKKKKREREGLEQAVIKDEAINYKSYNIKDTNVI